MSGSCIVRPRPRGSTLPEDNRCRVAKPARSAANPPSVAPAGDRISPSANGAASARTTPVLAPPGTSFHMTMPVRALTAGARMDYAHPLVYARALQIPAARVSVCELVTENRRRSRFDPEYELIDTSVLCRRQPLNPDLVGTQALCTIVSHVLLDSARRSCSAWYIIPPAAPFDDCHRYALCVAGRRLICSTPTVSVSSTCRRMSAAFSARPSPVCCGASRSIYVGPRALAGW
jgi:hypothetical protein